MIPFLKPGDRFFFGRVSDIKADILNVIGSLAVYTVGGIALSRIAKLVLPLLGFAPSSVKLAAAVPLVAGAVGVATTIGMVGGFVLMVYLAARYYR